MMRCAVLFAMLMVGAGVLDAQSYGYLFGGVGAERGSRDQGFGHVGLGGEWLPVRVVGIGGEVGVIGLREFGGTFAMLSANGSIHVPTATKFDPFFTAGVGVGTNFSGGDIFANLGGGINYWVRQRVAFRAEFRAWPWPSASRTLYEVRAGLAFR
jgi:hypothetical protein